MGQDIAPAGADRHSSISGDALADGWVVLPQSGNDHPTVYPMGGVFPAADGRINIAPPATTYGGNCAALEQAHLVDDARFVDGKLRSSEPRRSLEISAPSP